MHKTPRAALRFASALMICAWAHAAPDILIADFEGKDYGDWVATGEAFGPGPALGTLGRQGRVTGYLGKGLVNTFFNGDRTVGTLTSPELRIQRRYVNFLVGGGGHAGETCINLTVDGKPVRTANGPNETSGGSERLEWCTWDVSQFIGKLARIQIVDDHRRGWGHINVDHISQSDAAKAKRVISRYTGDMVVDDFERESHAPWQATGTAFGPGPWLGSTGRQRNLSGYRGKRLINSYTKGDRPTGTLVGPLFEIERRYVNGLRSGAVL